MVSSLDRDWLLNVRRKLYAQSRDNPDYVFHELWGLFTDLRNLRNALAHVAHNRGRQTAGIDGVTVRKALANLGAERLVENMRADLRSGAYRPSPARRALIPKAGQPGKFRPLGIPTVNDRIAQAALKNILEPIFEADFFPTSHGFRPGKSAHGALEHLQKVMRPPQGSDPQRRPRYQWAIEGDIKACFDSIDHHALMVRIRRRIGDSKTNRLVGAFLKAGVLSDDQSHRTTSGTPQGGILSPLLANIALAAIDERYERHVWPRRTPTLLTEPGEIAARAKAFRQNDGRRRGAVLLFPIRYADDFIVLVGAPPGLHQHEQAEEAAKAEKTALADYLRNTVGLELSDTKTKVTPITSSLRFLGHHVRVRLHPTHGLLVCTAVIPKDRSQRLREFIKAHFSSRTLHRDLGERLRTLNPVTRGWSQFYRHAWGAKRVFATLDHYVWWTILRWVRKKHPRIQMRQLESLYGWHKPDGATLRWRAGGVSCFEMGGTRVERFRHAWLKGPDFRVNTNGEPGAY
jgi:group II intron reverse transcriptase/maturase